ncbi:hypothetical protein [Streptomyces eurocidicus]|uniref:Uncharacterized protein n=1 Tax=Streptomyces eurocidicus TaxID=66423 RepID=A0A7W8BJT6_STREU|nr:hypothetical protein [Streptomyces eurocidicus]MBB5122744.1 hypothetical protein [Streptomyces eurocidicus]MBF6055209.1 hypothetical protein [Streptomyces eurocidicus]
MTMTMFWLSMRTPLVAQRGGVRARVVARFGGQSLDRRRAPGVQVLAGSA